MLKGEFVRFLNQCGPDRMPMRFTVRVAGRKEPIICDLETVEVVTIAGEETVNIDLAEILP